MVLFSPVRYLNSAAFLFLSVSLAIAQGRKANTNEQFIFSAEDEVVEQPAPLADSAIEAITRIEETPRRNNVDRENLMASAIHLSRADESDLIVIGKGYLRGAHVVPFWVLRRTNQGYDVLLATTSDGLKILNARQKGYRTIEVYNVNAGVVFTTTYGFDGSRYQRFKVSSSPSR